MEKKDYKSGFVNIIGNPNVGKSTLMNKLIGERLSIITSKAQTTRHRILGIVNHENYQIVFSDTPGIIQPNYNLQSSMMKFVRSAFQDADVFLYMVEIGEKSLKDSSFFERLKNTDIPILLLINKIDPFIFFFTIISANFIAVKTYEFKCKFTLDFKYSFLILLNVHLLQLLSIG